MCLRTHTWGESGNWFSPFYYNAKKKTLDFLSQSTMPFYVLLLKNVRDFSNDVFHNIIDAACIIALDESINYSNDPAFSIIFK